MPDAPAELGRRLRERDRSAGPAALNLIEDRSPGSREAASALLAEVSPTALGGEAPAHLVVEGETQQDLLVAAGLALALGRGQPVSVVDAVVHPQRGRRPSISPAER